ncbi:MAG: hypothetical protein A3F46_09455 [Legionellales bacterium RIFCSPHIGHO2_12_FULL_42_9]|nr:MAG: hypothetical protein A3F46_09455 [Legionellales bacterium RIFCSPHIGHO2_12_FULL_42_9]
MLGEIGVSILDISTLPEYIPYDKSFNRYPCDENKDAKTMYSNLAQSSKAEYIDGAKVMIGNLAGRSDLDLRNILVTDFDISIDKPSLQMIEGDGIAFTFSGRHSNPSTRFDTENSMIFISKDRPKNPDGTDIIQYVLTRIKSVLESPRPENFIGKYGCFVFSTLCHDPLVAKKALELPHAKHVLYPSRIADGSEDSRELYVNSISSSGRYLIHGEYFSDNAETWKKPQNMHFIEFDKVRSITERHLHKERSIKSTVTQTFQSKVVQKCLEDSQLTINQSALNSEQRYHLEFPVVQSLIKNDKLTTTQLLQLTTEQCYILKSEIIQFLIKNERLTIKSALELKINQCYQLESAIVQMGLRTNQLNVDDVLAFTEEQRFNLNFKPIQALIQNKLLTVLRVLELTPSECDNLRSYGIHQYINDKQLTVDEAIALTLTQKNNLELWCIQKIIGDKSVNIGDVLALPSQLSDQQVWSISSQAIQKYLQNSLIKFEKALELTPCQRFNLESKTIQVFISNGQLTIDQLLTIDDILTLPINIGVRDIKAFIDSQQISNSSSSFPATTTLAQHQSSFFQLKHKRPERLEDIPDQNQDIPISDSVIKKSF